MSRLTWDNIGERFYEIGIDRGVIYLSDSAVVWNGLTAIEETFDDASKPFYIEGVKYLDAEIPGDFAGTIKALTYPEELDDLCGVAYYSYGLSVDDQPPKPFHLCYRTKMGNDLEGSDLGYQIHILYNLTAVVNNNVYVTLNETPAAMEFSWALTAVPMAYENYRPTAHVVLDSTDLNPYLLQVLEGMLYGTDDTDPSLPTLPELAEYIVGWDAITITDNGDGTWTAEGPDEYITMLDSTTFEITHADATYLDADTYTITDVEV